LVYNIHRLITLFLFSFFRTLRSNFATEQLIANNCSVAKLTKA
jgi:hypothetical protein